MERRIVLVAKLSEDIKFKEDEYIGVDRGALVLAKQHIQMKAAIGDFDSVDIKELELIKEYCDEFILLPREKDETDSEAAIKYALSKGYTKVVLQGAMNGRSDHFLANVMLVYRYQGKVVMEDENNCISYLKQGVHFIEKNQFTYVSFVAFEDCEISLEGVAYPLSHQLIHLGDVYTISNEIVEERGTVSVYSGHVLLIQSRDANFNETVGTDASC